MSAATRNRMSFFERLVLGVFVFLSIFPILVAIVSSFKAGRDIFTYKPVILFTPTLENYSELFLQWGRFGTGLLNSLVVTLGSVGLTLLVCLPAAYAMSRIPRYGIGRSSLVLLIVEMLPPLVVTVPLFPIFSTVGLDNSRFGLMLVYATFEVTLATFVLKTFIDGIPVDIEEAAAIDGCPPFQRFYRIVLPLILPGVVTVAIYVALFAWNDFMFGLILTTSRTQTAPVVLADMLSGIGEGTATWGNVFAAATIQMIPMLAFTWLVQRQLLSRAVSSAIKG
jgi:multiple sugar transport system permease protein